MIVVTGPSGNVGRELVNQLASRSTRRFRIVSRHPAVMRERDIGTAEVATLDFFDRSTWDGALAGVDSLFLLFPLPGNKAAREAIIPFIEAAGQAAAHPGGVRPRKRVAVARPRVDLTSPSQERHL